METTEEAAASDRGDFSMRKVAAQKRQSQLISDAGMRQWTVL